MTFEADLAAILDCKEKFVMSRARALKILPVCGRCGGCGSYSFNMVDGSRCYGCEGSGMVVPKKNQQAAVIAAAKEAVASGENARYVEFLHSTASNRKAVDDVLAAWRATGISDAYDWRKSAAFQSGTGGTKRDFEISEINAVMHNACDAVQKASMSMPGPFHPEYRERALKLAEARAAALETIAAAKVDLDNYLAANPL